jgi:hypothetical protein
MGPRIAEVIVIHEAALILEGLEDRHLLLVDLLFRVVV